MKFEVDILFKKMKNIVTNVGNSTIAHKVKDVQRSVKSNYYETKAYGTAGEKHRKEAFSKAFTATTNLQFQLEQLMLLTKSLHDRRQDLRSIIEDVYALLNKMRNCPENIQLVVNEIQLEIDKYDEYINTVQMEITKLESNNQSFIINAVDSIINFSPKEILSVVSIFGSSKLALSGTIKTVIGGVTVTTAAPVAVALSSLLGPIGWGIGGSVLISKLSERKLQNIEIANEYLEQVKVAQEQANKLQLFGDEVLEVLKMTNTHRIGLEDSLMEIKPILEENNYNFQLVSREPELVTKLGTIINNVHSSIEFCNFDLSFKEENTDVHI